MGLGAAAVTFLAMAIGLTVLDMYLAGHALPRPLKRPFTSQMDVADAVALGVSAVIGAIAMVRHARGR